MLMRGLCCAEGHPEGSSSIASDGFREYMLRAFGASDASLQPQSALLSAFQQRLQALDVPQPLLAVISQASWPPTDVISSHETTLQLAPPAAVTSSGGSSIMRKRKGYSSPSDRGRPPRKSKAEGVLMASSLV